MIDDSRKYLNKFKNEVQQEFEWNFFLETFDFNKVNI